MYNTGEGVEKDAVQALRWLREAARHGMPASFNAAGLLLRTGAPGVPVDYAAARAYFEQAVAAGPLLAFSSYQPTNQKRKKKHQQEGQKSQ